MSSPAVDNIEIVNTTNLEKIAKFFNDSSYRETIEISANFNTRLCLERRLRLPFLDPQTGVAQNHCSLFMDRRQRMPGFREGQLYTYPSNRWRKSRRQYLSKMLRPFSGLPTTKRYVEPPPTICDVDSDFNGTLLEESSSLGGADTSDSKESQILKEDLPREWYFDELDLNEMDVIEDPKSPADDEYDYDPRYGSKKRRKRRPGRKPTTPSFNSDGVSRKGRPPGGGSSSSNSNSGFNFGSTSTTGRGRGRRKNANSRHLDTPSRKKVDDEPPSFESAALAVVHACDDSVSDDLMNYRKYL